MKLEKWKDGADTWVEVTWDTAKEFFTCEAHSPWDIAQYLNAFVRHAPPAARAQINPRMKIKVLVTTPELRWNENPLS